MAEAEAGSGGRKRRSGAEDGAEVGAKAFARTTRAPNLGASRGSREIGVNRSHSRGHDTVGAYLGGMRLPTLRAMAASALVPFAAQDACAAPPADFIAEPVASGWSEVVGTPFMPDGKALVWERGGRIWIVDAAGVKLLRAWIAAGAPP